MHKNASPHRRCLPAPPWGVPRIDLRWNGLAFRDRRQAGVLETRTGASRRQDTPGGAFDNRLEGRAHRRRPGVLRRQRRFERRERFRAEGARARGVAAAPQVLEEEREEEVIPVPRNPCASLGRAGSHKSTKTQRKGRTSFWVSSCLCVRPAERRSSGVVTARRAPGDNARAPPPSSRWGPLPRTLPPARPSRPRRAPRRGRARAARP